MRPHAGTSAVLETLWSTPATSAQKDLVGEAVRWRNRNAWSDMKRLLSMILKEFGKVRHIEREKCSSATSTCWGMRPWDKHTEADPLYPQAPYRWLPKEAQNGWLTLTSRCLFLSWQECRNASKFSTDQQAVHPRPECRSPQIKNCRTQKLLLQVWQAVDGITLAKNVRLRCVSVDCQH